MKTIKDFTSLRQLDPFVCEVYNSGEKMGWIVSCGRVYVHLHCSPFPSAVLWNLSDNSYSIMSWEDIVWYICKASSRKEAVNCREQPSSMRGPGIGIKMSSSHLHLPWRWFRWAPIICACSLTYFLFQFFFLVQSFLLLLSLFLSDLSFLSLSCLLLPS